MSTHHNFDHSDPTYIPQGGNGRTMRVHFTGRDWVGQAGDALYHMPSPNGLDRKALLRLWMAR